MTCEAHISIKDAGYKPGGGALKAVELTLGDLLLVAKFTTEGGVIGPTEPATEVSRGHSNHESGEGPNGPPRGG